MHEQTIAFIGAGNMASALIGGLIAAGHAPDHLIAADPDAEKRENLAARHGIRTRADNAGAVATADVLVLAVKPQVLASVAREIAQAVQAKRPLVISIAAGIRSADLARWLGEDSLAIVRCMPNTPALVGAGASGLYAGAAVGDREREVAEHILRAGGLTIWLDDETQLDAVTALSGSGPAYFFLFMEALIEAGCQLGLSQEQARLLGIQTALGSARMALESDEDPASLRARVTSPGGTTERAIASFEQAGLRAIVERAATAAHARSVELSSELGKA